MFKRSTTFYILCNNSVTKHRMYSKLYIFRFLRTIRVIWYTSWHNWSILKFPPPCDLEWPLPECPGFSGGEPKLNSFRINQSHQNDFQTLVLRSWSRDLHAGPLLICWYMMRNPVRLRMMCLCKRENINPIEFLDQI